MKYHLSQIFIGKAEGPGIAKHPSCVHVCVAIPACISTFTVAAPLCILSLMLTLLWWSLGMISTRLHRCACPCMCIPFQALLRSFFTCANLSAVVLVAYCPLSTIPGLAFLHLSAALLRVHLCPILSPVIGFYMWGSPLGTLSSVK
jgi:hypothetical protein